jgi:menaquinone-dependent protoporphyrinogen IX oxidase
MRNLHNFATAKHINFLLMHHLQRLARDLDQMDAVVVSADVAALVYFQAVAAFLLKYIAIIAIGADLVLAA